MCWHPEVLLLLAKQRQADSLREVQQIALARRALEASGRAPSLLARLLAAWSRRARLSRASEPALSEPAPR